MPDMRARRYEKRLAWLSQTDFISKNHFRPEPGLGIVKKKKM